MTERNRTAVHVHLLLVEAELADDCEALRRERLVQLHQVDLPDRDARSLEQLADGRDRSDPHYARVDTGDSAADETAEWLRAQLARLLLARDDHSGRAVVDAAGIAGGDGSVAPERGLQSGELLRARVRAGVLVAFEPVQRDELVVEATGLVR